MGLADSALRDRVVFVEGAPRSGTTLLISLLSIHPEVAGTADETHLFDQGVGTLFDNHEREFDFGVNLAAFVTRAQLIDLVRDLSDGVLQQMRSAIRPQAHFVAEKTPAVAERPEIPLARKLECYPDAWYIHIVRDTEAVTRSLMRMPWNTDPSEHASKRWCTEGVAAIRDVLGGQERYREVRYEDLAADPVSCMAGLFDWLGLDFNETIEGRIGTMTRERLAHHAPEPSSQGAADKHRRSAEGAPSATRAAVIDRFPSLAAPLARSTRLRKRLRKRVLERVRGRHSAETASEFADAFRLKDKGRLETLTSPHLEFTLRSPQADFSSKSADARRALLDTAQAIFGQRFLIGTWTAVGGRTVSTILFSGVRPDTTRVDFSLTVLTESGQITRASLISAGPFEGRAASSGPAQPRTRS